MKKILTTPRIQRIQDDYTTGTETEKTTWQMRRRRKWRLYEDDFGDFYLLQP